MSRRKPREFTHAYGATVELLGSSRKVSVWINGERFGGYWSSLRDARGAAVRYIDRRVDKYLPWVPRLPYCIPVQWRDARGVYWLAYHHGFIDPRLYSVRATLKPADGSAQDHEATVDDFGDLVRVPAHWPNPERIEA